MSMFEFRLPDIGEGVSEGEIVEWHVAPGQRVVENDPMLEVMTDKVTVTIGAPRSGTIADMRGVVGEKIQVGSVLVVIDETGSGKISEKPRRAASGPAATAVGDLRESLPGVSAFRGTQSDAPKTTVQEKPPASPATRKLARDLGIDLRAVKPSGENGRVLKDDVMRAAQGAPLIRPPVGVPSKPLSIVASHEERKPFVGMRRRIAERMQHAKRTAAHFTFVEECDASVLVATRERLQAHPELREVRLSFLPFIVKSVVAALKKFPILNCYLDETKGELVFRYDYHIGIATATDQGLMVPVLTHADRRGLREIAVEIDRLSHAARSMTISAEELSGSTFTITSLGKNGGLMATPVLNMPEVGIMGVHRIKQKPVVKHGQIVIGDVMTLSFTFDHRIVDGHIGAAFAYEVIAGLEEPTTLLL